MTLEFETPAEGAGVRVVDAVERRRLTLRTTRPVDPRPVPPAETDVSVPVDAAVGLRTAGLRLAELPDVFVRNDGDSVASVDPGEEVRVADGPAEIELNASVKLYVRVPGGATIAAGIGRVAFDPDAGTVEPLDRLDALRPYLALAARQDDAW